ncbi:MAG: DUF4863 family protein [Sphingomonadales bacterium]
MTVEQFSDLVSDITDQIAEKPLDQTLHNFLNQTFPPEGARFRAIEEACGQAIDEGWMCNRKAGGIAFGRVLAPGPGLHEFSVDVVKMTDVVGPHHIHPRGEIDMIMPITPGAVFDGHGRGWCVYAPGSAHRPTVTGGTALVLYLLPDGAIKFTGE